MKTLHAADLFCSSINIFPTWFSAHWCICSSLAWVQKFRWCRSPPLVFAAFLEQPFLLLDYSGNSQRTRCSSIVSSSSHAAFPSALEVSGRPAITSSQIFVQLHSKCLHQFLWHVSFTLLLPTIGCDFRWRGRRCTNETKCCMSPLRQALRLPTNKMLD